MKNPGQSPSRWKELIERYVSADRDGGDSRAILREGREQLGSVDVDAIHVFADALADDEKMWFVFYLYGGIVSCDCPEPGVRSFFLRGNPLPEELFEQMMRAALRVPHISSLSTQSHSFIRSLSVSFGYRRCAEFLIAYCDAADVTDVDGIVNMLGGLSPDRWAPHPDYPSGLNGIRIIKHDYESEGLSDVRAELVKALVRCYIRFDNDRGVRRSLAWIIGFKPTESQADQDLLLEAAASMGIDSTDARIVDILNPGGELAGEIPSKDPHPVTPPPPPV